MSRVEKVSVALTGEQVSLLKAVVETGEYATTSEIVREALKDWQMKRDLRQDETKRLRKMWDEGKASGEAGSLNFKVLRHEAKERLAAMKKAMADEA